ncbi:MAG: hypothetical protein MHM6MM_002288 [Cercozoa sp. M6MM]
MRSVVLALLALPVLLQATDVPSYGSTSSAIQAYPASILYERGSPSPPSSSNSDRTSPRECDSAWEGTCLPCGFLGSNVRRGLVILSTFWLQLLLSAVFAITPVMSLALHEESPQSALYMATLAAGSAGAFIFGLSAPVAALAQLPRVGTRKLVFVGAVLATVSLYACALEINDASKSDKWLMWKLFALLASVGTGMSTTLVPPIALVQHHFETTKHRAIANGISACSAGVGALVTPLLAHRIQSVGLSASLQEASFVSASGALAALLMLVLSMLSPKQGCCV